MESSFFHFRSKLTKIRVQVSVIQYVMKKICALFPIILSTFLGPYIAIYGRLIDALGWGGLLLFFLILLSLMLFLHIFRAKYFRKIRGGKIIFLSLYFIILFCISFFAYSLRNLLFSTAFLVVFCATAAPNYDFVYFSLDPTPEDEKPLSYDHTLYDPTSLHPDSSSLHPDSSSSPHHQESIPPVVDVDMDTSDSSSSGEAEAFLQEVLSELRSPTPSIPPVVDVDMDISDSSSSGEAFPQEEEVLSEPRPPTRNISLETSIRNRLRILEGKESRFLLGMSAEEFWEREVKQNLDESLTQNQYNWRLDFQSRYCQIMEKRHLLSEGVLHIFKGDRNLQANAPSDLIECIFDFCTYLRDKINENEARSSTEEERDHMELSFLDLIVEDIKRHGPSSPYIRNILDH